MNLQFILELVSAGLTIIVLLYLVVGDNALFRIVSYSFIGVTAGYVLVLILFQVLVPRLLVPIVQAVMQRNFGIDFIFALVALLLGILLLFKISPNLSFIGNVPMAVLVGVGAAVAIGGAIFGTIFGQVLGTAATFPSIGEITSASQQGTVSTQLLRFLEGGFVLVGTICTLAYFHFSVVRKPSQPLQRPRAVEILAKIGQIFIGITLGATFAGVFAASIAAFIERIGFLINVLSEFL